MKKLLLFSVLISVTFVFFSCKKDTVSSEKLNLLTSHIWTADSLLADGVDESGPGGLLEMFHGDTKFNEDGSGYVGNISGTWKFSDNENALIITSDSLLFPVSTNIAELTEVSLKLTTSYPKDSTLQVYSAVRMTFIPK